MSTVATHRTESTEALADSIRPWLPLAGLIAFCGTLFVIGLGDRDLTSSHEARAAQNAQMILDEGHWLVPRLFDRHLELQKPPLYYWLVALIAWLKGGPVDVWAVRLPAAVAAWACVLFLYFVGVQSGRPRAGWLAGAILASCVHFTWMARVGRIDMPLTTAITFTLGAFYLAETLDSYGWRVFGYASLGIGILLKGPIALVLVAVVAGSIWLLRDRTFSWRTTSLWWGVPLALAIAAPWYVWANYQTNNQLWEVFFWYHNVERGLGGSETLKAYPWWFYGPQAAVDLLPWSLLTPVAVYLFCRGAQMRSDEVSWSGLIWFLSVALFLSCMSFKRADYLLPAYPGLAIFLAVCVDRWLGEGVASSRIMTFLVVGMAAYAIGWLVYLHVTLPHEEKAWPYRAMAEEVRRQTKGPVIFFRAESHLLMHHLGPPVDTILEWENLDWWTKRPNPVYFVMPESCLRELADRVPPGVLAEVLRTSDYATGKRDRPLVILRSRGLPKESVVRSP